MQIQEQKNCLYLSVSSSVKPEVQGRLLTSLFEVRAVFNISFLQCLVLKAEWVPNKDHRSFFLIFKVS